MNNNNIYCSKIFYQILDVYLVSTKCLQVEENSYEEISYLCDYTNYNSHNNIGKRYECERDAEILKSIIQKL